LGLYLFVGNLLQVIGFPMFSLQMTTLLVLLFEEAFVGLFISSSFTMHMVGLCHGISGCGCHEF